MRDTHLTESLARVTFLSKLLNEQARQAPPDRETIQALTACMAQLSEAMAIIIPVLGDNILKRFPIPDCLNEPHALPEFYHSALNRQAKQKPPEAQ